MSGKRSRIIWAKRVRPSFWLRDLYYLGIAPFWAGRLCCRYDQKFRCFRRQVAGSGVCSHRPWFLADCSRAHCRYFCQGSGRDQLCRAVWCGRCQFPARDDGIFLGTAGEWFRLAQCVLFNGVLSAIYSLCRRRSLPFIKSPKVGAGPHLLPFSSWRSRGWSHF